MKITRIGNIWLMILALMQAGLTQAATEFEDNVPEELVRVLLNSGFAQDVGLYQDIMADFPAFVLPDSFTVLGSLDQGFVQRVILETENNREQAGIAIFDALSANGWLELPQPDMLQSTRGFVPSGRNTPTFTRSLCHDDLGNINVSVQEKDDRNLVSLTRTNMAMINGIQPNCRDQVEQRTQGGMLGMGRMTGGVMAHLPTLEMPESEGVNMAPIGLMQGGGSNSDWETRSNINIDWEIAALLEFFVDQIEEQGWIPDSGWSGSIAAGGNWTKTPEDNLDLVTMLSIVKTNDGIYELRLRVTTLASGQSRSSIMGGINIRSISR